MITTSHADREPAPGGTSVDQLDAAALGLLVYDVSLLQDADLARPTPCDGWNVADLLRHMNEQHDSVAIDQVGAAAAPTDDPRAQFAISAARWTLTMASGNDRIRVPGLAEPVAKEHARAVHFVDMLVHRWDLAAARGRSAITASGLIAAALPIAEFANTPGSPLFGTAYQPPRAVADSATPSDRLAALLGRDPAWVAHAAAID